MGLFGFLKCKSVKESIDLTDFKFLSNNHIRYEQGRDVSRYNYGTNRGIRVQSAVQDTNALMVTIYNMDKNHPLWGYNIQMGPKHMKIAERTEGLIKLKGFGIDALGNSFENYGLTLHIVADKVKKVTLHMYARKIDIVYKKK